MRRRRLLAAAVGTGLVLSVAPASAAVDRGRADGDAGAQEAVALLDRAATAARRLSYTGTQYVASWRGGVADTSLVELAHDPVRGSVVSGAAGEHPEAAGATAFLDLRMLDRLAVSYDLAVSGPGQCTGRDASVVEARRADGGVAGRFWVDSDSGMLLRREVFDEQGKRVRSAAFVDLAVQGDPAVAAAVVPSRLSGRERPAEALLERLRDEGWHVPEAMPDGFALFEARRDGEVLHLAYTDGLSVLSLFAQTGGLGQDELDGFARESVDGAPVWVRRTAPERVVWQGGGQVWTLVSDGSESSVQAALLALPHDAAVDQGLRARLSRGVSRLAGMLNPLG